MPGYIWIKREKPNNKGWGHFYITTLNKHSCKRRKYMYNTFHIDIIQWLLC